MLNAAGCERFTCNDAYKLKKSQKWWYIFTTETEWLACLTNFASQSLIGRIIFYDLLASIFIMYVGFSITISQSWLTIGGRGNFRKFRNSGPQDCNGLIWSAFFCNLFSFNLDNQDNMNTKRHKSNWLTRCFNYVQYPPIWPSFKTSILYRIGSFLWIKSVKLIIMFLARQNLMCSEHSSDESSYDRKYEIRNKRKHIFLLI